MVGCVHVNSHGHLYQQSASSTSSDLQYSERNQNLLYDFINNGKEMVRQIQLPLFVMDGSDFREELLQSENTINTGAVGDKDQQQVQLENTEGVDEAVPVDGRPAEDSFLQTQAQTKFLGTWLWKAFDVVTFGVLEKPKKKKQAPPPPPPQNKTQPAPQKPAAPVPVHHQEVRKSAPPAPTAPAPARPPPPKPKEEKRDDKRWFGKYTDQDLDDVKFEPRDDDGVDEGEVKVESNEPRSPLPGGKKKPNTTPSPDRRMRMKVQEVYNDHKFPQDRAYIEDVFHSYSHAAGRSLEVQAGEEPADDNNDDADRNISIQNANQAWQEIFRAWGIDLEDDEERRITRYQFKPLFKQYSDAGGTMPVSQSFDFMDTLVQKIIGKYDPHMSPGEIEVQKKLEEE